MVMDMAMVKVMCVCTRECESRRGDRAAEAANSATVAKGG